MVTRTRFRTFLTTLTLYTGVGLLIGYFWVHAHSGNHGLRAKDDLAQQLTKLQAERARVQRERAEWERRVSLLRSGNLDPDTLDERARTMLEYVHSRDLVFMTRNFPHVPMRAANAH